MKKNIIIFVVVVFILAAILGAWWWQHQQNLSSAVDSSLANVIKKGKLVVGSDIPYGVMEFIDKDGQPAGIDVDIAKEVASRLGVQLEFKDYDWNALFSAVKSGEIDLAISSISITPERKNEMLFSAPYFSGGQSIVIKVDNQIIKTVADLTNKRIGAQKDTTGYVEAKKYTSENLITAYEACEDSDQGQGIVYDLKTDKLDAIMVDYIQALSIGKNEPILKILGKPLTQEYYGIVTRIGNDSLLEEVDRVLRDIKREDKVKEIENRWVKN